MIFTPVHRHVGKTPLPHPLWHNFLHSSNPMHCLHRRGVKCIPRNPFTPSSQKWTPWACSPPAFHEQKLKKEVGEDSILCVFFPWLAVVICTLLSWALHLAAAATATWQVHAVVWPGWPDWEPFLFIAWLIENKTSRGEVFPWWSKEILLPPYAFCFHEWLELSLYLS